MCAATPSRAHAMLGAISLLCAVCACGDDADDSSRDAAAPIAPPALDASLDATPDAGEGCQTLVSDSLIDHACFHELMGPHQARTADANASTSGIDVDRAHTSFRVKLPALAGGRYGGVVTYRARSAGEHAIFSRAGEVRVTQEGSSLSPRLQHATEICAALPVVAVYALAPALYTLELESDVADVVLVIEAMSELPVDDAYRVQCDSRPPPARDAATFILDASPLDAARSDASSGDGGGCQLDPVLEHSCLHAQHGPFEGAVAAASGAGTDVSKVHTAWNVELPAASAGSVSFRPATTGEFVFYLDRSAPLGVRSPTASLTALYSEPAAGCSGITEARVYAMVGGERHDVAIGPVAGDRAMLIVESVQSFSPDGWAARWEACP